MRRPTTRLVPAAGLIILITVLAGSGGQAFATPEPLWRDIIATNPEAWIAHNKLGRILAARGSLSEAIEQYRTVLRADPQHARANKGLQAVLAERQRQ